MKRVLIILVSVMMILPLTSCTSNVNDENINDLLVGEEHPSDNMEDYDLTIASCGYNKVEMVIPVFEEMYNMNVRVIEYDPEKEMQALDTKLMAEDDDIDIFYTASLPIYKYIQKGYYVDLGEFEKIKQKIVGNSYTKIACCYDGEYFGLSVDPHITNEERSIMWKYLADNVNLVESEFADSDGSNLFDVLKYIYNNPDDVNGEELFDKNNYNFIIDSYLVISPFSQNKDTAVLFLETVFDFFSGELSYQDSEGNIFFSQYQYPNAENVGMTYFSWNITNGVSGSVIEPLWDAYNTISNTDGSDEALRELARDAARQVRMRLEG